MPSSPPPQSRLPDPIAERVLPDEITERTLPPPIDTSINSATEDQIKELPQDLMPSTLADDSRQALNDAIGVVDIPLLQKGDIFRPSLLSRIIGLDQAKKRALESPTALGLEQAANDSVNRGGLLDLVEAQNFRKAALDTRMGLFAFELADIEDKPRRSIINLMAARQIKSGQGGGFFLTPDEFKKAVADGWNGTQYRSALDALALEAMAGPAQLFRLNKSYARRLEEANQTLDNMIDRHTSLKVVDTIATLGVELSVAMFTEYALYLGPKKGIALLKQSAGKISVGAGSFDDAVIKRMGEISEEVDLDITEIIARRADIEPDINKALELEFVNDLVDSAENAAQKGIRTLDDAVMYSAKRDYITSSIKPQGENFPPVLKNKVVAGLIDKGTAGRVSTARLNQGNINKVLDKMTLDELGNVVDDIDTIRQAPKNFKSTIMGSINSATVAPPTHTFRKLGLEKQWMNIQENFYTIKNYIMDRAVFIRDAKRRYKNVFNKKWGDEVNEAMAYIANGDEISDDLRTSFSDAEIGFMNDVAQEDARMFWDTHADLAEARGKITRDPELIAAGIPERKDQYFHWIHEGAKDRYARTPKTKKVNYPLDYHIERAMKKKPATAFNYGEFLARKGTPDDIIRDWETVSRIAHREQLRMLYAEPSFERMQEVINALQEGSLKAEAATYFSRWTRQARNIPSGVDEALNLKVFNPMSGRLESVIPKWEASGRSWERFASTMSRQIDRGLILGNMRPVAKNTLQSMLNIDIIGPKSTLWGLQSVVTPGGRDLASTSMIIKNRFSPVTKFDITTKKGWDALTYGGIGTVDRYLNTTSIYNGALHYQFTRNKNLMNELVDYAATKGITSEAVKGAKFDTTLKAAIDDGLFAAQRQGADYLALAYSQWLYDHWNASPLLRTALGKLGLKYTSWPQNYFGAHVPQMWNQLTSPRVAKTGKLRTAIDPRIKTSDIFGAEAPASVKYALVANVARVGTIAYLAGQLGYDMTHLFVSGPLGTGRIGGKEIGVSVSPSTNVVIALGELSAGVLGVDGDLRDQGLKDLWKASHAFVPGSAAFKRLRAVQSGKAGIESFLITPLRDESASSGLKSLQGFDRLKGLQRLEQ